MSLIKSAGRYTVTAQDVELVQLEAPKSSYIAILFSTDTGDELIAYRYLTTAAKPNTKAELLEAFGFDGNFNTLEEQIRGKPASIVVELETYKEKERAKVKWINPPGGGAPKAAATQSFRDSLTADFARIPVAAPKVGASARPTSAARPPAARPAPSIPDDDVPF